MAKTATKKVKEKITVEQAKERFKPYINVPFGEIFTEDQLKDIETNKGRAGQLVEGLIGKSPNSDMLDFANGELKTSPIFITKDGRIVSRTTIAICMISSEIDSYLRNPDFKNSHFGQKVANVLFVFICKSGPVSQWHIVRPIHICLNDPEHKELADKISSDFYSICASMKDIAEAGEKLHSITPNHKDEKGEMVQAMVQIRTKSARRKDGTYYPIYSKAYQRELAPKGYAFYFTSNMTKYLISLLSM